MMTNRQKRRFMRQFEAQVEQERNGAPTPPDIAARMTKPKADDVLWQVTVEARLKSGEVGLRAYGPRWNRRDAADVLASEINKCVATGHERTFTKAFVVPLTQLSGVI